jgi:flagellar hook-length control protein FliK
VPSAASENSAIQHMRHQPSAHRNRTDNAGREQSAPFSDLLDSATPANEAPPAPRKVRAERSDTTRPTENRRKADHADRRKADHAERRDDAKPAKETPAKETQSTAAGDKTRANDETAESARSGDEAAAAAGADEGNTIEITDEEAKAALDAEFAAALNTMIGETAQPAVTTEITVGTASLPVAVEAVVTDFAAAGEAAAAASGDTPAIDPLAALQAAEQAAAPSGAAKTAQDQAAAEGGKITAEAAAQGEVKADAKKAEAKPDPKPLLQAEAKPDAQASAQNHAGRNGDAAGQDGKTPDHGIRHEAAKPDAEKPEAKPHLAADAPNQAKAATAGQAPGATPNAPAADAQASAHASAQAATAIAATPATPPPLTPAHIQAGLAAQFQASANASPAIPLSGVAVEIASQALAGNTRFEIRLDPAELGRIDVKLDIDGDGNTTTRVMVERADTLELLKRDANQLERALQQAGLKTSDNAMEFSLRQEAFQQNDEQGSSRSAQIVLPDDETPVLAQRQGYGRLLGMGGGLDIRI